MENTDRIWKTVLGEIQTEVSTANFLTLLKNTSLVSLEGDTATVAAPSAMIIDLLKKRFYNTLKKSLDKNLGKNITIVFIPKTITKKVASNKEGPLFSSQDSEKKQEEKPLSFLRPLQRVRGDFTFDNMAVSSSNQLAYVSAQTVAKNIGKSYNPLFIYGPTGVGKTHLMQAIANEVFRLDTDRKIIYLTSEEFTNEVVEAIRTNDTAKMKRRFRSSDLLIIDDVQFLAGKDKVQEELFHTFNILIDNSSQVVLSSDRPPQEIKKLEKRLSSRFTAGLTVDIEPPDFELRSAILLIKAQKYNVSLSMEAAKMIAQHVEDTRALEGMLLRIITEANAKGVGITDDFVSGVITSKHKEKASHVHPDDVILGICSYYNIKPTILKGPKRDAGIAKARQVAMYILKKEYKLTLAEIGNLLGGRDHTTVMYGVEKMENLIPNNKLLSSDILGINKILSEQHVD